MTTLPMDSTDTAEVRPWYRCVTPWLLLSGPIAAVIAGFVTLWFAIEQPHALVVDDYSKIGLTQERDAARDATAAALHLRADLTLSASGQVDLQLTGTRPATLTLKLIHPTLANYDQQLILKRTDNGHYVGAVSKPLNGRRYVQLIAPDGTWRLDGSIGPAGRITLKPPPAAER